MAGGAATLAMYAGLVVLVDADLATAADLQTAQRLLRDPAFTANHPLMITAWGRKPG